MGKKKQPLKLSPRVWIVTFGFFRVLRFEQGPAGRAKGGPCKWCKWCRWLRVSRFSLLLSAPADSLAYPPRGGFLPTTRLSMMSVIRFAPPHRPIRNMSSAAPGTRSSAPGPPHLSCAAVRQYRVFIFLFVYFPIQSNRVREESRRISLSEVHTLSGLPLLLFLSRVKLKNCRNQKEKKWPPPHHPPRSPQ